MKMITIDRVVSDTKAVVRVEKRVKICLSNDFMRIAAGLRFDTDLMLSSRGTDFTIYANTGYQENTQDTDLLVGILNELMTSRSGVYSVQVEAFGLNLGISRAVTTQSVVQYILDGAHRAGYQVEFVNLDPESHP